MVMMMVVMVVVGVQSSLFGVCDGAQILRFFIVSALFLSRSPTSCSERR